MIIRIADKDGKGNNQEGWRDRFTGMHPFVLNGFEFTFSQVYKENTLKEYKH